MFGCSFSEPDVSTIAAPSLTAPMIVLYIGDSQFAGRGAGTGTVNMDDARQYTVGMQVVPLLQASGYSAIAQSWGEANNVNAAGHYIDWYDPRTTMGVWAVSGAYTNPVSERVLLAAASGAPFTFTPTVDTTAHDWWIIDNGGAINFKIDGATVNAWTGVNDGHLKKVTVTAGAKGAHVYAAEWVSGTTNLVWGHAYNPGENEFRVIILSNRDWRTANWTQGSYLSTPTAPDAECGLYALAADAAASGIGVLPVIGLGANDIRLSGNPIETSAANVQQFYDALRAGGARPPILCCEGARIAVSQEVSFTQDAWAARLTTQAAANSGIFLDPKDSAGTYEANTAHYVDTLHPDATIYAAIAAQHAPRIIQQAQRASAATLKIADASAAEGGSLGFAVTVVRGGYTGALTLNWSVSGTGGNPADAADFPGSAFPSGTVTIAAGSSSGTITVNTNDDAAVEANETFLLTVSVPEAGATVTATGTITNNDAAASQPHFRAISAYTSVTSGDITLTEPTGAAEGDLLVACIASDDAVTTVPPAGWTAIADNQHSGSSATAASAVRSIEMFWIVRGASAPSYAFTRTSGVVARGTVSAHYAGGAGAWRQDVSAGNTLASYASSVTVPSVTTTGNYALLLAAVGNGRVTSGNFQSCVSATDPATPSTATVDTSSDDAPGTWIKRGDSSSGSPLTGVALHSAIKQTAGATGITTVSYSATYQHRAALVLAAFVKD